MSLRKRSYLCEMAIGGRDWQVIGHGGNTNSLLEKSIGPFVKQIGMLFVKKLDNRLYDKSLYKFYHGYGNANITGVGTSKNGSELKWDFVLVFMRGQDQIKARYEYSTKEMSKPYSSFDYIYFDDDPMTVLNRIASQMKNI